MKLTLTFDLPKEREEADLALHAPKLDAALRTYGEYLRAQIKYVEPEERDDIVKARERFYQVIAEVGIEI